MATKMRRAKDCEERRLGQPGVGMWDRTRTALLPVAGDLDSRMSGRCIYASGCLLRQHLAMAFGCVLAS